MTIRSANGQNRIRYNPTIWDKTGERRGKTEVISPLFWARITDFARPVDFRRHLDALIEAAGLDAEFTHAWLQVRVVDF